MKLKLSTGSKASSPTGATPPPPTAGASTPAPLTGTSTGGFKLKIRTSAPPTPAAEFAPQVVGTVAPLDPPPKPKRPYVRKPKDDGTSPASAKKSSNKREADSDISPAPKRVVTDVGSQPTRRISFKLSTSSLGGFSGVGPDSALETPVSAGPRLKLGHAGKGGSSKKSSSRPKNITLTTKRRPPPRPVGVGYDSEASDAELDPAIEQQFVLRMPDPYSFEDNKVRDAVSADATYLRDAVTNKTLGMPVSEGGADVSFRFVTRDMRRAIVTVRSRKYAAVLVDLPCVVESMKSWDRKGGWWKVADICQCLLVLGPLSGWGGVPLDEEAKTYTLPKEVDKEMRYAHGLTPPMHWVRKRRFRKGVSYKDVEGVEEEVERLLREDKECAQRGGEVKYRVVDGDALDAQDADIDYDEGDYFDGVEGSEYNFSQTPQASFQQHEDEIDDADLLAGLENMGEDDEGGLPNAGVDSMVSKADALAATRSSSAAAQGSSGPGTPGAEDSETGGRRPRQESSSDEDDDEDDDDDGDAGSMDAVDDDAVEEAKEQAAQKEEIEDLEREVANKRAELERVTNQLLKQRVRQNLKALEDELAMKRKAFNMEEDEYDE